MSLLDIVTGGKTGKASGALKQAMEEIAAVRTPTVEDLQFEIQKLTQAGVLSPEEAKTYLQDPNALLSQIIPQTGTEAQVEAIGSMLEAARQGGLDPRSEAKLAEIIQQLNTQERGANSAVVQRQAERGALTGGETMAAQLMNNQSAAANANQLGLGTAAEAYNQMLNELTSAGSMGNALQGQQNQQANTVAAATNAINQFNTTQQQNQENYNVGNRNTAQAYNLENQQNISNQNVQNANQHAAQQSQLSQQVFNNEMQKAAAKAGIGINQANNYNTQGGQEAALIGGLAGTAGEVVTGMSPAPAKKYAGGEIRKYLDGGVVDGEAQVPGDSPANDTVPAMLSPGEIVLPRSVAQNPQPDKVMSFLNRIRKPKAHPEDIANVFHALGQMREEGV